jgi:hypothetical protein
LEDSNERIFEASIAAEMLRSAIAVHFATIVNDFICAEHDTLHVLVSPVIKAAVKTLRMVTAKLKAHAQALTDASSSAAGATTTISATTIATTTTAASATIESSAEEGCVDEGEANGDGEVVKKRRIDVAESKEKEGEEKERNEENEEEVDGGGKGYIQDVGAIDVKVEVGVSLEGTTDGSGEQLLKEDVAREWKRTFLGACRWFDVQQKKHLSVDNLEMILHSAMREISRSDISDAVSRVVTGDKFRYEGFL